MKCQKIRIGAQRHADINGSGRLHSTDDCRAYTISQDRVLLKTKA